MLKKIVLVGFSAFLSLACNTVPVIDGKMVVETDFKEVQPLRGTVCDLTIEGDPNHIYQVDSLLVVKDNNTDKSLFLYSEKDYKLVNNMLSRGRGPGEFILCWDLQCADSLVWLFDLQLGRISSYATADFIAAAHPAQLQTVTFDAMGVTLAQKMNDGKFVASSLREDELFTFYRADGVRDTLSTGKAPYPFRFQGIDDTSLKVKKRIFEYRLKYNGHNDKFVVCYCLNNLFEIYNSDGSLHKRIIAPYPYLVDTNHLSADKLGVPIDELIFTFKDCCLTDVRIFLLYNGSSPTGMIGAQSKIYVFDYEGNPIKYYLLDRYAHSFCIDKQGGVIYALSDENDQKQVVRYSML